MSRGNLQHGHTIGGKKSPTFTSWGNMIARCTMPSNPAFAHYQRRGITVCDRWLVFANFLADMGERPPGKRRHTLERIKNHLGYCPGNCRWATWQEQGNNRSTNRLFTYMGKPYTLANLARVTGVDKDMLRSRLCRSKLPWTVEGAVKTPPTQRVDRKSGFFC